MAGTLDFNIEYNFSKPFTSVYDVILDFKKFGHFHPHMKKIEIVSKDNPSKIEYAVNEELLLYGCIPLKPNYTATVIEIEKNKHIQYTSQVKKNIFLTIDFIFSENKQSGVTIVKEKLRVKSNTFVGTVFIGILKKAHLNCFQNFNKDVVVV